MAELEDFPTRIILTGNQWLSMLADVELRAPEEACGLLGGRGNKVFAVVPVKNIERSRSLYRMDPGEQLRAFQLFEAAGWEVTGIYHSHPMGPAEPSTRDIAEAYYPEAVYLIWARLNTGWECRAFRIDDGLFHELEIRIDND